MEKKVTLKSTCVPVYSAERSKEREREIEIERERERRGTDLWSVSF
jgi:hypothetical protein